MPYGRFFGQPTPKTTSIKCMVGHALGAAGAESALAAVMAIRENRIPPTINYTEDPALGVDVVGNAPISHPVRCAIVNAFGFGGQNVVAVFGGVRRLIESGNETPGWNRRVSARRSFPSCAWTARL